MDLGSLSYMAPEILSGRAKKLGPSIDIWALGVVLYGLVIYFNDKQLCGQLPFTKSKTRDTIDAILTANYTYPSNVQLSSSVKDLISRYSIIKSIRIFICDESQRIRMIEIINHPWMKSAIDPSRFSSNNSLTAPNQKKIGFREPTKINYFIN